jgi:hypothetical protein
MRRKSYIRTVRHTQISLSADYFYILYKAILQFYVQWDLHREALKYNSFHEL